MTTRVAVSPADVQVENLSKRMGRAVSLDGVTLAARSGVTAIVGPNGGGKTTLLRCLATVLSADRGRVVVDGLDGSREAERGELRRRLGYLPQEVALPATARVWDIVDYLAVLKRMEDDRRRRCEVMSVLEQVGLRDVRSKQTRELSGGMRRRLALAQALLGSPTLLVLDEPMTNLDPDERFRVGALLTSRAGTSTIVMSTHAIHDVTHCDAVVVMHAGRVSFSGTPQALGEVARHRVWVQSGLPPPDVRASWRTATGYRCLGSPPAGATLVEPTPEDGYLLLR